MPDSYAVTVLPPAEKLTDYGFTSVVCAIAEAPEEGLPENGLPTPVTEVTEELLRSGRAYFYSFSTYEVPDTIEGISLLITLTDPEGCLGYAGFLAETAKSKQEINAALALLDRTCSLAGQGELCEMAGKMRKKIHGMTPDKANSAKKPPEQKAAPAPVPEDPEKLREACSQEDAAACLKLGAYYEHDERLLPDKRREQAMEVYGKLCQKRDPRGCQEFRRLKNALGR